MKTMKLQGRIIRATDERATELYMDGWQYVTKTEWKEYKHGEDLKDAGVIGRGNDVGMEYQDKYRLAKHNKLSKAQKRYRKKQNKIS